MRGFDLYLRTEAQVLATVGTVLHSAGQANETFVIESVPEPDDGVAFRIPDDLFDWPYVVGESAILGGNLGLGLNGEHVRAEVDKASVWIFLPDRIVQLPFFLE